MIKSLLVTIFYCIISLSDLIFIVHNNLTILTNVTIVTTFIYGLVESLQMFNKSRSK